MFIIIFTILIIVFFLLGFLIGKLCKDKHLYVTIDCEKEHDICPDINPDISPDDCNPCRRDKC